MAFTDRFIKIPTKVFDGDAHELIGKKEEDCDMISTTTMINPFKIECYRASIPRNVDFTEENLSTTSVTMESGDSHLAYMSINEFEKLLNKFGEK